jgi:hypothetical protein
VTAALLVAGGELAEHEATSKQTTNPAIEAPAMPGALPSRRSTMQRIVESVPG